MKFHFIAVKHFLVALIAFIALSQFLVSCKSTKQNKTKVEDINRNERDRKTEILLKEASSFLKTDYKSGGTTAAGMDCSGLVFTSFKKIDIALPRVSKDMSEIGTTIKLADAKPGDLIFFATSGKAKGINHVGIVTAVGDDNFIYFIHSTLKSGVTENNMTELYYQKSFVKVMRVY